jgi:hypothetical protein
MQHAAAREFQTFAKEYTSGWRESIISFEAHPPV